MPAAISRGIAVDSFGLGEPGLSGISGVPDMMESYDMGGTPSSSGSKEPANRERKGSIPSGRLPY